MDDSFFEYNSDNEFDGDDENAGRSPRRTPEKHLGSPICVGLLERISSFLTPYVGCTIQTALAGIGARYKEDPVSFYSGLKPLLDEYLRACQIEHKVVSSIRICDARDYVSFFNTPVELPEAYLPLSSQLGDANTIAEYSTRAFLSWIEDICKPEEVDRIRVHLSRRKKTPCDFTVQLYKQSRLWSEIVNQHRRSMSNARYGRYIDFTPFRVRFFDGFLELTCADTDIVYLMYEQVQMIQDALLGRFNVLLACDYSLHNSPDDNEIRESVKLMFRWHERCLVRYSNAGYELVKAPEALCKTYLTRLTNGELMHVGSYERTVEKIREKERKMAGGISPCVDDIAHQLESITNIGTIAELFGLIKLSGHPTVYAKTSARSARTEAVSPDRSVPYSIHTMERLFKHVVISGHISKFTEWPPFTRQPRPGTTLHQHWRNHATHLPLESYDLSDLDYIEFAQMMTFDYSTDYLKFIDDKAINPGAAEASSFWFSTGDRSNRRLILKILSDPSFDMKAIADRLSRGEFSDDELYIELTQKERELKESARCFCKLPITVRFFFTLTELNTATLMETYFPQQTMTMSDSEIKKRLYQMAYGSTKKNRGILEVDFSRWNLRWRDNAYTIIGRQMETMYGTPGMFTRGHDFFSRSTIVLTDRHYLPDGVIPGLNAALWPISDLVWRGHLGGFEGIQQKHWTILTILLVLMALTKFNLTFLMAGQGDNQVIVFSSLDHTPMNELIYKVLATLEFYSLTVNQVVKPDECIDSGTVLTYGKEIYISGVHVQYSLKFLSRTFAHGEGDIPTLLSEISAISSSSIAAASTLPAPILGRHWCIIQTILALEELEKSTLTPSYADSLYRLRMNGPLLKFALELPASLGGLPIPAWGHFLIRGEMDPLTWDLASILRLPKSPEIRADLQLLLDGSYMRKEPDISLLVTDPFSIPLIRPKDLRHLIRDTLQESLLGVTKNKNISPVLTASVALSAEKLLQLLAQWRPLYPHILGDIFDASIAGFRDSLYGRFSYTRTLQTITNIGKFRRSVEHSNIGMIEYITMRYKKVQAVSTHSLLLDVHKTSDYARHLRSYWLDKESTATITIDSPLAMKLMSDIVSLPCISAHVRTSLSSLTTTTGKYPPNFGTKTRQKRSEHGYRIISTSDSLLKIKMLTTLTSQIDLAPECEELIADIIRTRSPWQLNSIKPIFPTAFGGVAAHRHDSMEHKFYGIMGSCTVPTHLHLSSDRSGCLAGGVNDYAFVFTEAYLLLTSVFQHLSYLRFDYPRAIGLNVDSVSWYPLPNNKIEGPYRKIRWPDVVGNPLLYVDSLQFTRVSPIPDPTFIPKYVPSKSSLKILTSYFCNRYRARTSEHQTLQFMVSGPADPLDLAEFSCTNPMTLCRSIALSAALMHSTTRDKTGVYLAIQTMCYPLVRLFLTPDGQDLEFSQENQLFFHPSESYPHTCAEKLVTYTHNLYLRLRDTLKVMRDIFPICIAADYPSSGLHIVSCICIFILNALDVPSACKKRIVQLRDAANIDPLIRNYLMLSDTKERCQEIASSPDTNSYHIALSLLNRWPPLRYTTMDADELRRGLRALKDVRPKSVLRHPRATNLGSFGIVTFSSGVRMIRTKPMENRISVSHRRAGQLLYDRSTRRLGVVSTALSVWYPLLDRLHTETNIDISNTLNIGVGSGAIAAAIGMLGGKTAGLDVIEYLPRITQRETSLIPPEVGIQGVSNTFAWFHDMFAIGKWDLTPQSIDHTKFSLIIVDVETRDLDIVSLLIGWKTTTVVCRVFLTTEDLMILRGVLPHLTFFCTTSYRGQHSMPFVILSRPFATHHLPDPKDIDIVSIGKWEPEYTDYDIVKIRLRHLTSSTNLHYQDDSRQSLETYIKALEQKSYLFSYKAMRYKLLFDSTISRKNFDALRNGDPSDVRAATYLLPRALCEMAAEDVNELMYT